LIREDCFQFEGIVIPPELKYTKRNVLSLIVRMFDPLRLLNPFVMLVKIMFQNIWKLGLQWDAVLPDYISSQFREWLQGIEMLKTWRVARSYFVGCKWKELEDLDIHIFCDASEKGYGACVYLRNPIDTTNCTTYRVVLVMSRARVVPIKRVTLPRLELLGALMGARLLVLRSSGKVQYRVWMDSSIALSWTKGDPQRWKAFVSNRVTEIQHLTEPSHWFHVSSENNPADLCGDLVLGIYTQPYSRSNGRKCTVLGHQA
jgi:hypothetical protein